MVDIVDLLALSVREDANGSDLHANESASGCGRVHALHDRDNGNGNVLYDFAALSILQLKTIPWNVLLTWSTSSRRRVPRLIFFVPFVFLLFVLIHVVTENCRVVYNLAQELRIGKNGLVYVRKLLLIS